MRHRFGIRSRHDYDFFFPRYRYIDSTGEVGDFPAKLWMIEKLDATIPDIRTLNPAVFIATGDQLSAKGEIAQMDL